MPSSSPPPPSSPSKAQQLSLHFLETRTRDHPLKSSPSLLAQIEHRLGLVRGYWDVRPGSRVLEVGCGQGDCTVVLLDAVGGEGWVDALDPAPGSYGSPHNLASSQSHILTHHPVAKSLRFHNSSLPDYLETYKGPPYDYIILSHCTYYFPLHSTLPSLLQSITSHKTCTHGENEEGEGKGRKKTRLCIAEWSLLAPNIPAIPHILAVLLLATLNGILLDRNLPLKIRGGNVRTVFGPGKLRRIIEIGGGRMVTEEVMQTREGMLDARWEVGMLLSGKEGILKGLEEGGVGEGVRGGVEAQFAALEGAVEGLEGGVEGVRCMSVWGGVFEI